MENVLTLSFEQHYVTLYFIEKEEIEMNVLSYDQASEIYDEIRILTDRRNPDDMEFYTEMVKKAVRYANIRAGWMLQTREQRMENDPSRTSAHDSFINALNIFSRYQGENGAVWRRKLGDDRKIIGDFACYIALFEAISNR